MSRTWFAVLAALMLATPAAAQVAVAPTILFIGSDTRFGTYLVSNQSGVPQEVTVDFRFGYPESDSLGNGYMVYGDTLAGAELAITEWVRAFPRRFVVGPGEQQTVRLTVRPPADIADGTYWTRIVTTSTPQTPQVDTVGEGVAAQIIFRLEQITTVLYRNGEVGTGVTLDEVRHWVEPAQVSFLATLSRTGNSPFFGSATLRVRDAAGTVVGEGIQAVAIYFDSRIAFAVDRAALPAGEYSAEISVTPERSDIAPADQLPMEAVTQTVRFAVPG